MVVLFSLVCVSTQYVTTAPYVGLCLWHFLVIRTYSLFVDKEKNTAHRIQIALYTR